jgi:hypothetical protein
MTSHFSCTCSTCFVRIGLRMRTFTSNFPPTGLRPSMSCNTRKLLQQYLIDVRDYRHKKHCSFNNILEWKTCSAIGSGYIQTAQIHYYHYNVKFVIMSKLSDSQNTVMIQVHTIKCLWNYHVCFVLRNIFHAQFEAIFIISTVPNFKISK